MALSVADVLAVVRPDRAALPSLGAGGSLLAATMRLRVDSDPRHARGAASSGDGPPGEASHGERVRVWRVRDGSWFDPFEDWTTSWGATWSPDGRSLAAFVHGGHPAAGVAVWDSVDDVVRVLDCQPSPLFTFERPQWTPAGDTLIIETRSATASASAAGGAEDVDAGWSVNVLSSPDERPPAADPVADPLDSSDLTIIALSGERRVLARDWTVRAWRMSPDGDRVGCLRLTRIATAEHQGYFDLCVIDLHTGAVVTLARDIPQDHGVGWSWSPDGAQVAYLAAGARRADELWVVEADGRTAARRLTDGEGRWGPRGAGDERGGYQAPRWLDHDAVVWHREGFGFVTIMVSTVELTVTTTPDGSREQWLGDFDSAGLPSDEDGSFLSVCTGAGGFSVDRINPRTGHRTAGAVITGRGAVLTSQLHVGGWTSGGSFLVHSAQHPGEVWIVESGQARRLAQLNPGLEPTHTARRVTWSEDHRQLAMGLLIPLWPAPDAGWPLVIGVYGGSHRSSMVDEHDPTDVIHASLLTSRGWAVMFPDLPMTAHEPMGQFAPLVQSALHNLPPGLIDATRIAVIGHSYGSYTALSLLVTMPDTFCAAAISAPLANPLGSYGALKDDGVAYDGFWEVGQGRMGHPPWTNPQTWVDNSPFCTSTASKRRCSSASASGPSGGPASRRRPNSCSQDSAA